MFLLCGVASGQFWSRRNVNDTYGPTFMGNSNLRSSLLRCGIRPNERDTQWDSNSLLQFCLFSLLTITLPEVPWYSWGIYLLIFCCCLCRLKCTQREHICIAPVGGCKYVYQWTGGVTLWKRSWVIFFHHHTYWNSTFVDF